MRACKIDEEWFKRQEAETLSEVGVVGHGENRAVPGLI